MKRVLASLVLAWMGILFVCSVFEEEGSVFDEDEQDEEDDESTTCNAEHQCYPGGSQTGRCSQKTGHGGPHWCFKCGNNFW